MLERNMTRSEKRSPNRELAELSKTIKSKYLIFSISNFIGINKADLYETVLSKDIKEYYWDKFLNKVYAKPDKWI